MKSSFVLGFVALFLANCTGKVDETHPDGSVIVAQAIDPRLLQQTLQQLMDVEDQPEAKKDTAPSVKCPKEGRCVVEYYFHEEVNRVSAAKVANWITAGNKAHVSLLLLTLNSGGGDIDAGFELIRTIENSQVPVYCVAEHETMSEAFAILQSCQKRLSTLRAALMTHEPGMQRAIEGHAKDFLNAAESLRVVSTAHAHLCSAKMKMSFTEYLKRTENGQDFYMTAEEALKYGAVDELISSYNDYRESLVSPKKICEITSLRRARGL